jgi:hypothetical protein
MSTSYASEVYSLLNRFHFLCTDYFFLSSLCAALAWFWWIDNTLLISSMINNTNITERFGP